MKSEEIYNAWKEQKSQVEIEKNFTDKVMNQVYIYEQNRRKPLFDVQRFFELISAHPLVKAGMIAAGVIAGFIRMAFTVYVFLGT